MPQGGSLCCVAVPVFGPFLPEAHSQRRQQNEQDASHYVHHSHNEDE